MLLRCALIVGAVCVLMVAAWGMVRRKGTNQRRVACIEDVVDERDRVVITISLPDTEKRQEFVDRVAFEGSLWRVEQIVGVGRSVNLSSGAVSEDRHEVTLVLRSIVENRPEAGQQRDED
ncbi:MAG: hypothetical protein JXA69_13385 [Phycisphaerae bacterium]|nr:hypothetical protein [Phycisphaerae bacterium]